MGWHSDTLWISDPGLSRLTLFKRDGVYLRSIVVPVSGSGYLLENGNMAVVPTSVYMSGSVVGPPMLVTAYSPSGRLIDTLLSLPPTYRVLQFATPVGMSVGSQPFEDGPLVKLGSNGKRLFVVERRAEPGSRRFRVIAMNDRGDTLYNLSFPYRPVPLTDGYVNRAVEELLGQGASRSPELKRNIERAIHRPSHLPPLRAWPRVRMAHCGLDGKKQPDHRSAGRFLMIEVRYYSTLTSPEDSSPSLRLEWHCGE
jgi:hypothetical protein